MGRKQSRGSKSHKLCSSVRGNYNEEDGRPSLRWVEQDIRRISELDP